MVELGPHSYNLKQGGQGGFDYANQSLSDEKRREISRKGGLTCHISKEELTERLSVGIKSSPKGLNGHKKALEIYPRGGFFQKHHTDEVKKKISEASRIHQKGERNSQFGTMWITDGIANRKIKKDAAIPEGWRKGMIAIKK